MSRTAGGSDGLGPFIDFPRLTRGPFETAATTRQGFAPFFIRSPVM